MTIASLVDTLNPLVDQLAPTIVQTADDLWTFSELGLEERRSSALLGELLTQHGFRITQDNVGGMPTAFVAEYGSGGPLVGILAEFDALPGLGNAAVPRKQPRADGVVDGHACGHNLIATGPLGAALALRQWLDDTHTPGRVRFYACPAEEIIVGKVVMAKTGVFDDLDAAVHWHPADRAAVMNVRLTGLQSLLVEFFGTTAHAATDPWNGRSALDALELFAHAANQMREHVPPTARIHYIFLNGGAAENVVPDYASLRIRFREATRSTVDAGIAWLNDIAAGVAQATQTRAEVTVLTGCHDLLPNTPLAQRTQEILEAVGTRAFVDDEQTFARAIQYELGLPETGMFEGLLPMPDELAVGGSSDVGDVSKITPTMGFALPSVPTGVSMHTWAASACHGMSLGQNAAVQAARVLAVMVADLLTNAELRQAAKEDFDRRLQGQPYVSPLPANYTLPVTSSTPLEIKVAGNEMVEAV